MQIRQAVGVLSTAGGEARSFMSKGRCKECWGELIGRTNFASIIILFVS